MLKIIMMIFLYEVVSKKPNKSEIRNYERWKEKLGLDATLDKSFIKGLVAGSLIAIFLHDILHNLSSIEAIIRLLHS